MGGVGRKDDESEHGDLEIDDVKNDDDGLSVEPHLEGERMVKWAGGRMVLVMVSGGEQICSRDVAYSCFERSFAPSANFYSV